MAKENFTTAYKKLREIYAFYKRAYNDFCRDFSKEYTEYRKNPLASYASVELRERALGILFPQMIGVAWLCEKLKLNVKFSFIGRPPNDTFLFENLFLSYSKTYQADNILQSMRRYGALIRVASGREKLSNEYGYKVISRLGINRDIQQQADQWYRSNAKRKCVGVHYRGTDATRMRRVIKIEGYIAYLEKVLEKDDNILACSDQAQFIAKIHEAFPGRVLARNIMRSYDWRSLHWDDKHSGSQQMQDALIDLLVLAKTEVIYTPGSGLIDAIRFLNPSIKVISLDGRRSKDPNYLPVPYPELVREIRHDTAWKASLLKSQN